MRIFITTLQPQCYDEFSQLTILVYPHRIVTIKWKM